MHKPIINHPRNHPICYGLKVVTGETPYSIVMTWLLPIIQCIERPRSYAFGMAKHFHILPTNNDEWNAVTKLCAISKMCARGAFLVI